MIDSREIILTTLTPLCSHGADQAEPEFRITELKSLMRFWWRAINIFEDDKEMKDKEAKIFGSTDCKSPLQIKRNHVDKNEKIKLDHWLTAKGIPSNRSYHLIFSILNNYKNVTNPVIQKEELMDYYINLLKISLILGGLGSRSRRGAGILIIEDGVEYNSVNNLFDELKNLFHKLSIDQYYIFDESKLEIFRESQDNKNKYPYLEKIILGRNVLSEEKFECKRDFEGNIKNAMREAKKLENKIKINDKKEIKLLEYANTKRMACPVYVSAYGNQQELFSIISLFYNTNPSEKYNDYKEIFINEVIK